MNGVVDKLLRRVPWIECGQYDSESFIETVCGFNVSSGFGRLRLRIRP